MNRLSGPRRKNVVSILTQLRNTKIRLIVLLASLLALSLLDSAEKGPSLAHAQPTAAASQFIWPIDEPVDVTQPFACVNCLDSHKVSARYAAGVNIHTGQDLRPRDAKCDDYGTVVKAAADGIVLRTAVAGPGTHGLGSVVIIAHAFGLYSLYAHLDKIAVVARTRVRRGSVIGTMGNSSKVARDTSFCTHVHFEVKARGVLGDIADDCQYWGYSPGRPENFGYLDPAQLVQPLPDQPPYPYIDKGACPGEGCTYGEWLALSDTTLFASPDRRAAPVGTVRALELVRAVTGEVWTVVPGRATAIHDFEHFRKGDLIYLLTYQGEGSHAVWHRGQVRSKGIPFAPNASSRACEHGEPECWGKWDWSPTHLWWVQMRTAAGVIGWTDETERFSHHHPQYEDAAKTLYECVKRGTSGSRCLEPIQALVRQLKAPDSGARYGAAVALLEIGPAAKDAVPTLTSMLRDSNRDTRGVAVVGLGSIGSPASSSVPRLLSLSVSDSDEYVRREACTAAGRIQRLDR
jgi:murein DD-endopeptidase MepM/ murein hydrolase activator NlpD